jgi:hypothetical protein
MAKAKTVAVHAGTRRSERNTPPPKRTDHEKNEDPLHPGFKTVLVPKTDPRDPRAASPVGWYEAQGYEILDAKPYETGHTDQVKMGLPIDEWLSREKARVDADNEALTHMIDQVEMGTAPGVVFDRKQSGVTYGDTNLGEVIDSLPKGSAPRREPDELD